MWKNNIELYRFFFPPEKFAKLISIPKDSNNLSSVGRRDADLQEHLDLKIKTFLVNLHHFFFLFGLDY